MKIDIGISAKDRKQISQGLSYLLADTYTLYLKTHGFHWNVTGPMFNTLHTMFMAQYNELWLSLDEIAERIRALDHTPPASGAQYAKLSSIKEETGVPDWKGMVQQLVSGHETCARTARNAFALGPEPGSGPLAPDAGSLARKTR